MAAVRRLAGSLFSSSATKWHARNTAKPFSLAAATTQTDSWGNSVVRVINNEQKQVEKNGVHWVFLGCPGVGKGTYASRLANLLSVPHIAMGDLVRQELSAATPLARELAAAMSEGKLLPDDVIVSLLSRRLEKGATSGETGFILDGFPRTLKQAEILEGVADINLVVNLKLREDVLVTKCVGRRICSECGGNFNIAEIDISEDGGPRIVMPPLLPPPSCASKLTIRADDTEEVVRKRLQIYADESKPVEDFYRQKGRLMDFEINGGIPETWPLLLSALKLEDKNAEKLKVTA